MHNIVYFTRKYDVKKRIFLLKFFYEFKRMASVQSALRVEYKTKIAPDRKIIINIVFVLEMTGTVARLAPKRSLKREDAKNQLESMATDFSTFSIRKEPSANASISHSS